MSTKKIVVLLVIVCNILCMSAFACHNKKKDKDGLILESISITPPPGGLSEPIFTELSEEEINNIPAYGETQED